MWKDDDVIGTIHAGSGEFDVTYHAVNRFIERSSSGYQTRIEALEDLSKLYLDAIPKDIVVRDGRDMVIWRGGGWDFVVAESDTIVTCYRT